MKKLTSGIVLVLLAVMMVFTGCSSNKEISVSELSESLISEIKFDDKMSKVDQNSVLYLYQIEEDLIKDFAVYESTGATAEEVAVFEAASGKAKELKAKVEARVETQKKNYENYVPEELVKLGKPVIKASGNYIVLCVSNDNKKANEIIDKAL